MTIIMTILIVLACGIAGGIILAAAFDLDSRDRQRRERRKRIRARARR